MDGMDKTTHQLHYPIDDSTTQGHAMVPGHSGPGEVRPLVEPPTTMFMVPPEVAGHRVPPSGRPDAAPHAGRRADPAGAGRGRTTIADEVVEQMIQRIVDLAAEAVAGVHGLRPGVDRFLGGTGGGDTGEGEAAATAAPAGDRSVVVSLADGRATISLAVEIDFGFAVHEVVEQVRQSVITDTERLLGLPVDEVNVVVSDVSFDSPSPAALAEDTPTGRRPRSRT